MSRNDEFQFIVSFAAGAFFDEEIFRDRLRSLWTAYCLHYGIDAGTEEYANELSRLWGTVSASEVCGEESDTADWSDYDSFHLFMRTYI